MNGDKTAEKVHLRVVRKAAGAGNADQLDQLFKEIIATKTIVRKNVCLFIDGYYLFKNLKRLRDDVFRELIRTSSIPNPLDGPEIRLDQIPKPLLVLHDLDGASQSQLRDISFTLINEARHKIRDKIQQNLSLNDAVSYSNTDEMLEKCRQVSLGEIQRTIFDKITHVLEVNFEVRVCYAVLDASFYESQLEKKRKAEKIKEIPDLGKVKSIREALDALQSLKIISKSKFEREVENKTAQKLFPMDLSGYYEFIKNLRTSHQKNGEHIRGNYNFSIDDYGVSDVAKFEEKQVDVGLTIAAAEKIFDNEKIWSIGIITGDTDFLPIFRKSAEKSRNGFLLTLESIPFAYRRADFKIHTISLGTELDRYVRKLEDTRVQRLYNFIGALRQLSGKQKSSEINEELRLLGGLDEVKIAEFERHFKESNALLDEHIQRHIENCEKLYGPRHF